VQSRAEFEGHGIQWREEAGLASAAADADAICNTLARRAVFVDHRVRREPAMLSGMMRLQRSGKSAVSCRDHHYYKMKNL
jgi:hypothetical protein